MKLIQLHLCCNDGLGRASALSQVQIPEQLHISCSGADSFSISSHQVRINGFTYPIRALRPHVGNLHWDVVTVTSEVAVEIINDLMALYHWEVEEADQELWDALESERRISVALLEGAP